ncbi:hypothetical protein SAMN05216556_10785 [Aequorivita viscosa]|uniref:Uncharacterized protein n=1 Tax=Aequorivita viscosa TaxID=797419 RepID=A0A1M6K1I6_9FLAO|nr:hypothetical protein SAMN05216556_10785 [Aequorivita viscosa]SHJ52826.1 hypothetical protein SAMN04487908_1198 [Aequorivita viscosa]
MLNNDPKLRPKPLKISSKNINRHFLHTSAYYYTILHISAISYILLEEVRQDESFWFIRIMVSSRPIHCGK